MKSKTYLITGATGFIGRHLLKSLVESGNRVVATRRRGSDLSSLGALANQVQWVNVDSDQSFPESLCELPSVSVILHLATAYGRNSQAVSDVVQTNVQFPLRLLEWGIQNRVGLFLNTDTCFTTDYPYLRPYTLSKQQFIEWGKQLSADSETRFLTIELQHPYGPGDSEGKFVPWLIDQCLHAERPVGLTSGEQEKDFIYVDDVVAAYRVICDSAEAIPVDTNVIPCGTGQSVRVRDFVEFVGRACGNRVPLDFGAIDQRPGEVMRSVADPAILNALDWLPGVSLEQGIERTVQAHHHRADCGDRGRR
ncbi:dTDP-4-dehydro-6-deoxyglucose reductase [Novipirellula aureliae]|uniref:dTDP-4-dehydro-6-deoxyglucose reductase n=1 Tax=Novipirellula aureliae TaxID=2527966 RepID=A0A5C6E5Z6_9BACT|nr:NAD(P)-dependent oxidoreductase [Novipirellula aureliae]TWU44342.1 dTDP-4-dehydro-6-deoxyglucose reductase [Novipirellula aureliae]